jgi:hypothetical protein
MGAPTGNVNAMRNRPFAEAINRAIAQDDGARLRAIAEALLTKAADGDMSAIREFADRIDGKAHQAIEASIQGEISISKIERVIVDNITDKNT